MSDLNFIERAFLRRKEMNWLKQHWPAVVSAVGWAIPFLLPSLNAYIAAHPHSAEGVLLGGLVAAWYSNQTKPAPQK